MRYYIADCHFFHGNLNHRMDKRGFASVEDMNEYMIGQWNKKVRKNDEIVIIGDFSLGNVAETESLLKRLNGRKILLKGNHDRFLMDKSFDMTLLQRVSPYLELNDERRKVILCHYPIMCYNGQYQVDEDGSPKTYMLHGHVHDTFDQILLDKFKIITKDSVIPNTYDKKKHIPCNVINCFCMKSDYIPLTLDEWIVLEN